MNDPSAASIHSPAPDKQQAPISSAASPVSGPSAKGNQQQEHDNQAQVAIEAKDLTVAYGDRVIQQHLNFAVKKGDVFIVMGGSGSGKSSILRVLMGLNRPASGTVWYGDKNFWAEDEEERAAIMRKVGVLFQAGALWTSRTLAENIALPLEYYTTLNPKEIRELASMKLALVGLAGFEDYYPSELSGGMRKRAGLARALALDPEIVYFDEPSAGLDPLSAAKLDELILDLRSSLGMTVVVVTHELASIFAIGDDAIFLDAEQKTIIAQGNPHDLLTSGPEEVRRFLRRDKPEDDSPEH